MCARNKGALLVESTSTPCRRERGVETGGRSRRVGRDMVGARRGGHELAGAGIGGTVSGALAVGGSLPPWSSRNGGYESVISVA
jgi:hypothetical protein